MLYLYHSLILLNYLYLKIKRYSIIIDLLAFLNIVINNIMYDLRILNRK